ncbi:protein YgfX [Methylomonas koyamae]|uniref:protein YgfX n=1 Tax=Methylomonas koyamae TaxID=702114 RepID=UPI0006D08CA1|nr:protein YgfX [Methylomonas koyamae]
MYKNIEQSVDFSLGVSRQRRWCVSFSHLSALAGCWFNAMPLGYRSVLIVLVCLSWVAAVLAENRSAIVLRYSQQRGWSVQQGRGDFQSIRLRHTSVVSRLLVALHWLGENDIRGALVVFPDMLQPDQFRRLLVCLKITEIG